MGQGESTLAFDPITGEPVDSTGELMDENYPFFQIMTWVGERVD